MAAAIVVGLTLTAFNLPWRFKEVAPGPFAATGLQDLTQWRQSPGGVALGPEPRPTVALTAAEARATPYIMQLARSPGPERHVGISVELATDGVQVGREPWYLAVAALDQFDGRGRFLDYWPRKIAVLAGTTAWRRYTAALPVHPDTVILRLVFSNSGRAGTFRIRGVETHLLHERAGFAVLRWLLMAAWVGVALWCLKSLVAPGRRRLARLAAAGVAVVIVGGALVPQPDLRHGLNRLQVLAADTASDAIRLSRQMADLWQPDRPAESPEFPVLTSDDLSALGTAGPDSEAPGRQAGRPGTKPEAASPGQAETSEPVVRPEDLSPPGGATSLHFLIFIPLALFAGWAFGTRRIGIVIATLILFAAATEVAQLFLITRDTEWSDLGLDSGGIAVGLGLYLAGRATAGLFQRPTG